MSAAAWLSFKAPAVAQEKYSDFDDAYSVAARFVRIGDYPAAVAPLEAALKLAKDDAQHLKAYQALVPAYRLQPEIDKMLVAQEFIIRHTDRRAGRSIAARDTASYLLTRGKLDAAIERYDAERRKNPNDPAALSILTAIFTQAKRRDPRGPELQRQLDYLDRDLARQFAERLEKDAQVAPRTSSWHLKDAATAWLEAGDKTKALAAAKKSAAGASRKSLGPFDDAMERRPWQRLPRNGRSTACHQTLRSRPRLHRSTRDSKERSGKKLSEARGAAPEKSCRTSVTLNLELRTLN